MSHITTVHGHSVRNFRRLPESERQLNAGGLSIWVFEGRVNGADLELWEATGRWREDGKAHPLDLAFACPANSPT